MELNNKLPIKYITGAYKIVCDEYDEIGSVISIVNEIKRNRKNKKKWTASDIIFTDDILKSVFKNFEEAKTVLIDKNVIVNDGNLLTINPQLLSNVFKTTINED